MIVNRRGVFALYLFGSLVLGRYRMNDRLNFRRRCVGPRWMRLSWCTDDRGGYNLTFRGRTLTRRLAA